MGRAGTYAIHAAFELDLLKALEEHPRDVQALASDMALDEDALSRLLRALQLMAVVSERDGTFAPGPMAAFAHGGSIGDPETGHLLEEAWTALPAAVRSGGTPFEIVYGEPLFAYLGRHPEIAVHFDATMQERGKRRDVAVAEACDFTGFGTIVDVAGGTGGLLSRILERHPTGRGVLFDQPPVIERAAASLQDGLRPRIELVAGNIFESVPRGGDAYLLSSILHDWSDEDAVRILRNVRAAMAPAARLLIVEKLIPEDAPDTYALLDLEMFVLTGGRERTRSAYAMRLSEAGLELESTIATESVYSVLVVRPGVA